MADNTLHDLHDLLFGTFGTDDRVDYKEVRLEADKVQRDLIMLDRWLLIHRPTEAIYFVTKISLDRNTRVEPLYHHVSTQHHGIL